MEHVPDAERILEIHLAGRVRTVEDRLERLVQVCVWMIAWRVVEFVTTHVGILAESRALQPWVVLAASAALHVPDRNELVATQVGFDDRSVAKRLIRA